MDRMQPEELLARLIRGDDDPGPIRRRDPAETRPSVHWTGPVLLERAAYLRKMARASEGWAAETIRESPGHRAMLIVRLRNSDAEMLDGIAQMFFVLEGRATMITGGVIEKPRKSGPHQTSGVAIHGGSHQELRPGDVIHVAGGVPVQVLVAGEKPFSCLVMRMQEAEEERSRPLS
jgi:mannose-6-phosphate isomerase-like protein (cupin superfamily)